MSYNQIIKASIAALKSKKEWKSATKDDRKALQDLTADAAQLAYLVAKNPNRADELRNEIAVFRSRFKLIKATALRSMYDQIVSIAVKIVREFITVNPAAMLALKSVGLIVGRVADE